MIGQLILIHPLAVSIIFIITGLILAARGNKLIPLALILCGLFLGFQYGPFLLTFITGNPTVLTFAPYVMGALFAWLLLFLYKLSFFIAGLFLGYFISTSLFPEMSVIFTLICSLVSAVLLFTSRNVIFAVLTSAAGAMLFATGVVNLLASMGFAAGILAYWIVFTLTFLAGIFSQVKGRN